MSVGLTEEMEQEIGEALSTPAEKKGKKARRSERNKEKARVAQENGTAEPRTPRETRGYTLNSEATITFGRKGDQELSETNSPYKPDTKRAARWSILRGGMKVDEAVNAGLSQRRLMDMLELGYIVVTETDGTVVIPPANESAEAETAEAEAA